MTYNINFLISLQFLPKVFVNIARRAVKIVVVVVVVVIVVVVVVVGCDTFAFFNVLLAKKVCSI